MKYIHGLPLLILFFAACSGNRSGYDRYEIRYETEEDAVHPQFVVYNDQYDTTAIWFRINSDELLYVRKDRMNPFAAEYRISWNISNKNTRSLTDSGSVEYKEQKKQDTNYKVAGRIPILLKDTGEYRVRVTFRDLNRNTTFEKISTLTIGRNSPENFCLFESSGTPVFGNPEVSQSYELRCVRCTGTIYHLETTPDYRLPPPPFASVEAPIFRPAWKLSSTLRHSGEVMIADSSLTRFTEDTTQRQGYTITSFCKGFPDIVKGDQMLAPLRFLCTKREYDDLLIMSDQKKAAESFWLNRSGSKDRARSLIRTFYHRVETANRFFSSAREGWRTDRGLIHIIFGQPTRIIRRGENEIWTYGQGNQMQSIVFTFNRIRGPFANEYVLERGPVFKSFWYRAIETWRAGRAYIYR